MKRITIMLATALVFAVGSAFTSAKETKPVTKKFVNTYWVTGKSGSGSGAVYNLSTTQPQGQDCEGSQDPCRITTDLSFGATAPQSTVHNPAQVSIEDRQPTLQ